MKQSKIKIFIVFIILIFGFIPYTYGYSTEKYEIDIPSNYTQTSENSFSRDDGCNINIVIVPFDINSDFSYAYSETNLNELVNSINEDYLKKILKDNLKTKYGNTLKESEIDYILTTFKFYGVIKKEVTTFSMNNYDCFHIIYSISILDKTTYTDQYVTISSKETYTVTLTGTNENYCNSDEVKSLLDSFTIRNFKEITSNNISAKDNDYYDGAICLTLISVFIGGTIYLTTTLTRKNKQTTAPTVSTSPVKEAQEHIFCVYCGTKSNIKDNYCTNCGRELKK